MTSDEVFEMRWLSGVVVIERLSHVHMQDEIWEWPGIRQSVDMQ